MYDSLKADHRFTKATCNHCQMDGELELKSSLGHWLIARSLTAVHTADMRFVLHASVAVLLCVYLAGAQTSTSGLVNDLPASLQSVS